jgi:alanyl-tRNA synthetase
MELKLKQIPKDQKDVLLFEEDLDAAVMRNAVNHLMEVHEGICGIFVMEGTGYKFIIGSKNIDCRQIATLLREKLGARGGGSQAMIQGSLQGEKEQIFAILANGF